MFLKRLETVGFKSFAERTTIEFVPGVTAVVGPNGSGKSNVIDAVRWVLGEQSAKTLRGDKMEDIIFQGSDTRNQLNFAEVSLVLNNEKSELPIDYQEVSVTRRVYRSGESEFFINKQSCRLKDIVDLFMDTGLGRESFSIIGQGKIDEILSSKAEERRAIFEEAAGVLKYKQRKNKAEFKLNETASNLDRVEDIIHEIEQQIEPLRKQAEIAKQYKAKKESLKQVEVSLLITEIEQLHTKWKTILTNIEEEKLVEIQEKTNIQEKEAKVTKDRERLQEIDQLITTLQNELIKVTEQIEQLEGKRNLHIERFKHAEENKQKLQHEKANVDERIAKTEQIILTETEQLNRLKETIKKVEAEIDTLKNKQYNRLDIVKENLENLKSDYIEYLNEQAVLRNEQQTIEQQMKQIDLREQEQLESSKTYIEEEENLQKKKKQLHQELSVLEDTMNKKQISLATMKENLELLRKQYEQMQLRLFEGNEQIAKLTSKKDMLQEMKDSFQGFFFGVKEVLQAGKAGKLKHIQGPVLDLMEVPATYVTAIDTILGTQSQHIVVTDDDAARQAIEWLKRENKGRATFLPLKSIEARNIPNQVIETIKNEEGYVGIAADLIQTSEKFRVVANHLMGNVIITNNLKNATNIAQKTYRRYRVVTLDGDVVYPGGSMSGGAKKNKSQSLFTRDKELKSIEKTLKNYEARRNDFMQKIDNHKNEIATLESRVTSEAKELEQLTQSFQTLQTENNELALKLTSATDHLSTYDIHMKQFQTEKANLRKKFDSITKNLIKITDKIKQTEQNIETLTNEEKEVQLNEKNVEKQLHELEITIAEYKQRQKSHEERLVSLKTEMNELEIERKEINSQLDAIEKREQTLESEGELAEKITKLKQVREATTEELEARRNERTNKMQYLEDEEKEIRGLYRLHEKFIAKIQEKEVQANRLDVALENRLNFLQTEYVITYEKASELFTQVDDVEKARMEVKQIKRSIESLGTVNLGAIDEYERLQERYQFLTEQQNDLIEAKNTLYSVIHEMDKEMTERFSAIFSEIQGSFSTVFKQLFGGGHAELILTDPDNLLETGIDIVARPPGKKLRSLGLLSGGERALTAIALLFAILRARPVPFCILDEVDAALDEANVARFSNYLKTYSEESQFIVITHRKGTMEEADVLYGVTMQESGVSRLVSVRLEETTDLVEAT